MIYLLCGLPGSGKTFWAKEKEKEDFVRFTLDEEILKKHGTFVLGEKHEEYSNKIKIDLLESAKKVLNQGRSVIFDFGFWYKKDREEVKRIFEKYGDVKVFFFDVPKEIRLERVLKRNKETEYYIDENALNLFEEKFERPDGAEIFEILK
jgi:predicted kinase